MYPLTGVLIGCDENACPELKHELLEQGVKLEAEFADVNQLTAELSVTSARRRLFVVCLESAADCRYLERLNEVFPGEPIVALMYEPSESALLLQAMRAGAAQVVALPLQVQDLKDALERIALQFGYPANTSRLIAVSGVNEGSGATTLAINLAAEIASQYSLPVVLAELSLRMGRLASYLDLNAGYTTHDVISDLDRLDIEIVQQALVKVTDNFHVLAGPYKGIPLLQPTPEQVARLVEYTRRLAQVVVIDMPYTYDDVYFQTLASADHVVLIAEQNVPSLQALKTLRLTLQQNESMGNMHLVINRYDPHRRDFHLSQLRELLQVPHIFPVAYDAAHCADALNSGHVLRQETPRLRVVRDIDALAAALLGRSPPQPKRWSVSGCLRRVLQTVCH